MEEETRKLSRDEKKEIKSLLKQKKYDEIFFSYGRKAYLKYVPDKEKNKLMNKYADEGRYEDIYLRFGPGTYNKFLVSATFDEIKNTKGFGRAFLWKAKHNILKSAQAFGLALAIGATALPVANGFQISSNSIAYSEEIQEYIDKNQDYANSIKGLNLTDIETFMLVMNDMWRNIAGYANPEKDIVGFLELDLLSEDGFGVCRNMAKDVQKKINMINPKYNARSIIVQTDIAGIEMANIERKILKGHNDGVETETTYYSTIFDPIKRAISGNHAVVLVDIPDKNITLALDPTNPSIGVYSNGKIILLNPTKGGNSYDIRGYNTIQQEGNLKEVKTVAIDYINSYVEEGFSLEELTEMYGLDAQNIALDSALAKRKKVQENSKSFDERIKVEVQDLQVIPEDSKKDDEKNFDERY